ALLISYKILSEVEKVCEEKKIKKKDLAVMIGTSKSYITQLFRGVKQINTLTMAKFEDALQISFEVKARMCDESFEHFLSKQISEEVLTKKRLSGKDGTWYYCINGKKSEQKETGTKQFMNDYLNIDHLQKKDTVLQKVV
ncbi:MAG: XRE family transcriptional regulator, partial [Flavobacterium sp.]